MSAQSIVAEATPLGVRPQPQRPWRWSQHWCDLLFAHWRVPAAALRRVLPECLDLDTCGGAAWVSAVAFRLERVRPRRLPPLPLCSSFAELNLRTYVRRRGESAICFLSIHAGRRTGVALARWFTPLPYQYAPIVYRRGPGPWRFDCGWPGQEPPFAAEFRPGAGTSEASGTLDHFLLERYVAFASGRDGSVQRVAVEHPPWQVQPVSGCVTAKLLGVPWGLDLAEQPDRLHFTAGVVARVWPFERI